MSRLAQRAALCLPVAGVLLLSLIASPGASERASAAPSLRVTPGDHYVGGQALTFAGNIGQTGAAPDHAAVPHEPAR